MHATASKRNSNWESVDWLPQCCSEPTLSCDVASSTRSCKNKLHIYTCISICMCVFVLLCEMYSICITSRPSGFSRYEQQLCYNGLEELLLRWLRACATANITTTTAGATFARIHCSLLRCLLNKRINNFEVMLIAITVTATSKIIVSNTTTKMVNK